MIDGRWEWEWWMSGVGMTIVDRGTVCAKTGVNKILIYTSADIVHVYTLPP